MRIFGPSSELRVKVPFGLLAVLPAPAAGTSGGVTANKQLQASLERYMQPFLRPGAVYPQPALVHSSHAGTWEESLPIYGRQAAAEVRAWAVAPWGGLRPPFERPPAARTRPAQHPYTMVVEPEMSRHPMVQPVDKARAGGGWRYGGGGVLPHPRG